MLHGSGGPRLAPSTPLLPRSWPQLLPFCPCVVRSEPATLSLQEMQLLPPVKMPFARIRLENTVASQRSQKSQIWDLSLSQTKSFAGCLYGNPALVTFVETFGKDMRSMRLLCNGTLAGWLFLCLAWPSSAGSTCPAGPHRGCLRRPRRRRRCVRRERLPLVWSASSSARPSQPANSRDRSAACALLSARPR